MKLWIKKENDQIPQDEWKEAYQFSINRDSRSTIYTNLADTWYHLDQMQISPIYEDLFLIALSVFSVDKRVSRRFFKDCWTRDLELSIPVIEYEKWKDTIHLWENTLTFLTGDVWHIHFRKTDRIFSLRKNPNRKHIYISDCNCVSLFSGGLDSFCGAIKLLQDGYSPCLIGHNEYPKLRLKQQTFASGFQQAYPNQSVQFISFSANSRAPQCLDGSYLKKNENTSRGRSILFLCAALTIAGIMSENTPVFIPENGFIGLNLPLTDSRKGTCSTRTTHPYFLRMFNNILQSVGIKNPIINFYAYMTKREIVDDVKDNVCFKRFYSETISCSHPCQARWNRTGSNIYPINCGYCYPCLIRKSSLLDVDGKDGNYSYNVQNKEFTNSYSNSEKINDLNAVLSAVFQSRQLSDEELQRKIKYSGRLYPDETKKFMKVYQSTMKDLEELFYDSSDRTVGEA